MALGQGNWPGPRSLSASGKGLDIAKPFLSSNATGKPQWESCLRQLTLAGQIGPDLTSRKKLLGPYLTFVQVRVSVIPLPQETLQRGAIPESLVWYSFSQTTQAACGGWILARGLGGLNRQVSRGRLPGLQVRAPPFDSSLLCQASCHKREASSECYWTILPQSSACSSRASRGPWQSPRRL